MVSTCKNHFLTYIESSYTKLKKKGIDLKTNKQKPNTSKHHHHPHRPPKKTQHQPLKKSCGEEIWSWYT